MYEYICMHLLHDIWGLETVEDPIRQSFSHGAATSSKEI